MSAPLAFCPTCNLTFFDGWEEATQHFFSKSHRKRVPKREEEDPRDIFVRGERQSRAQIPENVGSLDVGTLTLAQLLAHFAQFGVIADFHFTRKRDQVYGGFLFLTFLEEYIR